MAIFVEVTWEHERMCIDDWHLHNNEYIQFSAQQST